MINLIGIYGENGVGKSTTARIISNLTGMEIKSFATPVKVMAAAYLNVPVETFENRDFKEKHREDLLVKIGDGIREKDPDFWVNHLFKSYECPCCGWVGEGIKRGFCIYGGEVVYDCPVCGEDDLKPYRGCNWVIDDVRKPNEIKAIRERGGIIIGVLREVYRTCYDCNEGFNFEDMKDGACPFCGSTRHVALFCNIPPIPRFIDYTIDNSGTEQELEVKIKNILNEAQNS